MALAFSSSAEEVLERSVQCSSKQTISEQSDEEISQCFELDRCLSWIKERSFSRVALQFPDELLPLSVRVAQMLGAAVADCKLYILGDTSFGSCCIDEVSAEHAACQGLIHFGPSCLSPPSRIEALLVLGVYPIDWTPLGLQASQMKPDASDPSPASSQPDNASQPQAELGFLVIVDTKYCSQIDAIRLQLPPDAIVGLPLTPGSDNITDGQQMFRRVFPTARPLTDFRSLLWVGKDGQALVNILLQFSSAMVWAYDPEEGTLQRQGLTISRSLMRRHFLVEKAKDARIIGILVGTLGVRNYLQAIGHLRDLIAKAGRKSYTLAVGKLNVAKLANFQEIDIYVYVACPENSFFDSRDFYRPVVTPYELEIALNSNREWGAGFFTDFNDILPGGSAYVASPEGMENTVNYDMSLISGKLRTLGHEHGPSGDATATSHRVLVERETGSMAIARPVVAGEMLVQRSWQGLDPDSGGPTPPSKLKSGRSGIAMEYSHEEHRRARQS